MFTNWIFTRSRMSGHQTSNFKKSPLRMLNVPGVLTLDWYFGLQSTATCQLGIKHSFIFPFNTNSFSITATALTWQAILCGSLNHAFLSPYRKATLLTMPIQLVTVMLLSGLALGIFNSPGVKNATYCTKCLKAYGFYVKVYSINKVMICMQMYCTNLHG